MFKQPASYGDRNASLFGCGCAALCTYLSAVVLVGLAANAVIGWWWMDPLAGLAVATLALREGIEAWRSGDLCAC